MPDPPSKPVSYRPPGGLARIRVKREQRLDARVIARIVPPVDGSPAPVAAVGSLAVSCSHSYPDGTTVADPVRAAKRLEEVRRIAAQIPGRKAAPCVSFVMLGPPRFSSPDAWPASQIHGWGCDVAGWLWHRLKDGSAISHAALHVYGAAPSFHALAVVADAEGRPGWNRILPRFGKTGKESGPALMSLMLTDFAKYTKLPRPHPAAGAGAQSARITALEREFRRFRAETADLVKRIAALTPPADA